MSINGVAPGCLFIFEGIDGSGKTTQVQLASANLTSKSIAHTIVESPGRSRLAADLREIIARHDANTLTAATEALLHLAVIRSSLEELVLPALSEGRHVLMDRSHLSTAAYQGANDTDIFSAALDSAGIWLRALQPNKIFYFDIEPQVATERIRLRGDSLDKYDSLPLEKKKLVRERYLSLSQHCGEKFFQIDASGDASTISQSLSDIIQEEIKLNSEKLGQ